MHRLSLIVALFCLSLVIYVATLTQVHTFDALSYVLSVERKPWTEVFHPHHLAYGPVGVLALAAGKALGYAGGAALPMQLVNAIAGALGVGLCAWVMLQVTQRIDVTLALALVLGGSYAYWYYAVEIEVYTVATLLLIVCLRILTSHEQPTTRASLWLGIAQGGAILFHQTNVLLCIPIAVWWFLAARRANWQVRGLVIAGSVYSIVLSLVVALPYAWVGFVVSRFGSLDAFMAWMTEYARTGWWGGPITWERLPKLGKGLSETLTVGWGGYAGLGLLGLGLSGWLRSVWMRRSEQYPVAWFQNTLSSFGFGTKPLTPGTSPARGRGVLEGRGEAFIDSSTTRIGGVLLAWLLVYGIFFFWWEPDNIEFWIASLPAVLLVVAFGMCTWRPWGTASWLALALAVGLGISNFNAISRRGDAATDLQRDIARALAANTTPADLLVVPDGLQELYLPYYQQRDNFISINQALFDANGSWEAACGLIRSRIEAARFAGATALIADEALHPPPELLARHRITQNQVNGCFTPLLDELEGMDLLATIPAYMRLPTAQTLADGDGWHFERSALGWHSAQVANESFADGWRMRPGSDPSLISPLLQIDTTHVEAIEIQLANSTQARDAQLFWIGPDGGTDEARSVRWQLHAGPEVQTYRIELRNETSWQGIVARLRIDPIGVGDGGEVRLVGVRLVRGR